MRPGRVIHRRAAGRQRSPCRLRGASCCAGTASSTAVDLCISRRENDVSSNLITRVIDVDRHVAHAAALRWRRLEDRTLVGAAPRNVRARNMRQARRAGQRRTRMNARYVVTARACRRDQNARRRADVVGDGCGSMMIFAGRATRTRRAFGRGMSPAATPGRARPDGDRGINDAQPRASPEIRYPRQGHQRRLPGPLLSFTPRILSCGQGGQWTGGIVQTGTAVSGTMTARSAAASSVSCSTSASAKARIMLSWSFTGCKARLRPRRAPPARRRPPPRRRWRASCHIHQSTT